jgi:hypothetical protein
MDDVAKLKAVLVQECGCTSNLELCPHTGDTTHH